MKLECPLPKLDFDVITLGHGSGGLLTNRLLDAGVFNLFSNEQLDQRHDGAVLDLNGKVAFTTDSFVVSPLFFPGGNIGDLAINGTINDLAMCGATPEYISVAFILEEGLKMEDFWKILVSIKNAADRAGVKVVTGDTKVVEKGKGDGIFINTSGVGRIHPNADIHVRNVRNGDSIIVSGEIANHGIAIMSVREGLEFESEIVTDSTPLNFISLALLDAFGNDIHLMRDPTRGGIATVLSEISQQSKIGIELREEFIPVNEQVDGACEMLGLDPLYVANEGVFAAFVTEEKSQEALRLIKSFPAGKNARIIGQVTNNHPEQVIMTNAIGGRRMIHMLPGEQLPRIC